MIELFKDLGIRFCCWLGWYWIVLALGVLIGNWIVSPLVFGRFGAEIFTPYPSMETFVHGVLAAAVILVFRGFVKLVKRIRSF